MHWQTQLDTCVLCTASLHLMADKYAPAIVFGKERTIRGTHQAKRCGRRSCRTLYWNNYRWTNKKKVGLLYSE